MPERARAVVLASTGTGDIIPDATVTVRNPGTTTNISETIYANDDPDATQLTNGVFKTDARGLAIFYLTDQKRVDVLFTKAGVTSVTIPVDVQKSSLVSGESVATSTIWDAAGDLAKGTGADTAARLARGTANQVLRTNAGGTDIEWGVDPAQDKITAAGDILYGTAADTATRLPIGTAGQVLKVNSGATAPEWGAAASSNTFIGAKAYRTTSVVSVANNAATAIDLNAEEIDPDNFHDNATNPSRLTIPAGKAGRYLVVGQLRFAANATGNRRLEIHKNGTRIAWQNLASTPGGAEPSVIQASAIIDMAATDYFQLVALQTSGGALDVEAGQYDTFLSCAHQGVA